MEYRDGIDFTWNRKPNLKQETTDKPPLFSNDQEDVFNRTISETI